MSENTYLTLYTWADNRDDTLAMLREVVKEIERGAITGSGGGGIGTWIYNVWEQPEEVVMTDGERAERLEAMNDRMSDTITDLRAELFEANSLLRSAFSIAKRKGDETNWDAFQRKTKAALDRQHKIIYGYSLTTTPTGGKE